MTISLVSGDPTRPLAMALAVHSTRRGGEVRKQCRYQVRTVCKRQDYRVRNRNKLVADMTSGGVVRVSDGSTLIRALAGAVVSRQKERGFRVDGAPASFGASRTNVPAARAHARLRYRDVAKHCAAFHQLRHRGRRTMQTRLTIPPSPASSLILAVAPALPSRPAHAKRCRRLAAISPTKKCATINDQVDFTHHTYTLPT